MAQIAFFFVGGAAQRWRGRQKAVDGAGGKDFAETKEFFRAAPQEAFGMSSERNRLQVCFLAAGIGGGSGNTLAEG